MGVKKARTKFCHRIISGLMSSIMMVSMVTGTGLGLGTLTASAEEDTQQGILNPPKTPYSITSAENRFLGSEIKTNNLQCNENHVHTSLCYNSNILGKLTCDIMGNVVHEHNKWCYDKNNNLVCTLDEVETHKHIKDCYETRDEIICGKEDGVIHHHTDKCYISKELYVEYLKEAALHKHVDECYRNGEATKCVFDEEFRQNHKAEFGVASADRVLFCGFEEGDIEHTHDDSCHKKEEVLICNKQDTTDYKFHNHSEDCWKNKYVLEPTKPSVRQVPALKNRLKKYVSNNSGEWGNQAIVKPGAGYDYKLEITPDPSAKSITIIDSLVKPSGAHEISDEGLVISRLSSSYKIGYGKEGSIYFDLTNKSKFAMHDVKLDVSPRGKYKLSIGYRDPSTGGLVLKDYPVGDAEEPINIMEMPSNSSIAFTLKLVNTAVRGENLKLKVNAICDELKVKTEAETLVNLDKAPGKTVTFHLSIGNRVLNVPNDGTKVSIEDMWLNEASRSDNATKGALKGFSFVPDSVTPDITSKDYELDYNTAFEHEDFYPVWVPAQVVTFHLSEDVTRTLVVPKDESVGIVDIWNLEATKVAVPNRGIFHGFSFKPDGSTLDIDSRNYKFNYDTAVAHQNLYPVWEKASVVTFHMSDYNRTLAIPYAKGSESIEDMWYIESAKVSYPLRGYFKGFSFNADKSTLDLDSYNDTMTYQDGLDHPDLYPVWCEAKQVTFHLTGSTRKLTVPADVPASIEEMWGLEQNKIEQHKGCTFIGFAYEAGATEAVLTSSETLIDYNSAKTHTDYFPVWTEGQLVTFHLTSGDRQIRVMYEANNTAGDMWNLEASNISLPTRDTFLGFTYTKGSSIVNIKSGDQIISYDTAFAHQEYWPVWGSSAVVTFHTSAGDKQLTVPYNGSASTSDMWDVEAAKVSLPTRDVFQGFTWTKGTTGLNINTRAGSLSYKDAVAHPDLYPVWKAAAVVTVHITGGSESLIVRNGSSTSINGMWTKENGKTSSHVNSTFRGFHTTAISGTNTSTVPSVTNSNETITYAQAVANPNLYPVWTDHAVVTLHLSGSAPKLLVPYGQSKSVSSLWTAAAAETSTHQDCLFRGLHYSEVSINDTTSTPNIASNSATISFATAKANPNLYPFWTKGAITTFHLTGGNRTMLVPFGGQVSVSSMWSTEAGKSSSHANCVFRGFHYTQLSTSAVTEPNIGTNSTQITYAMAKAHPDIYPVWTAGAIVTFHLTEGNKTALVPYNGSYNVSSMWNNEAGKSSSHANCVFRGFHTSQLSTTATTTPTIGASSGTISYATARTNANWYPVWTSGITVTFHLTGGNQTLLVPYNGQASIANLWSTEAGKTAQHPNKSFTGFATVSNSTTPTLTSSGTALTYSQASVSKDYYPVWIDGILIYYDDGTKQAIASGKQFSFASKEFYGHSGSGVSKGTVISRPLSGETLARINPNSIVNNTKADTVIKVEAWCIIPEYAFGDCTSLTSVLLHNGVTRIESNAFTNTSMSSIVIPGSCLTVCEDAFLYCLNLTNIYIQEGCIKLEPFAFATCSQKCTNIYLPKSMMTIQRYAFITDSSYGIFTGGVNNYHINPDATRLFYAGSRSEFVNINGINDSNIINDGKYSDIIRGDGNGFVLITRIESCTYTPFDPTKASIFSNLTLKAFALEHSCSNGATGYVPIIVFNTPIPSNVSSNSVEAPVMELLPVQEFEMPLADIDNTSSSNSGWHGKLVSVDTSELSKLGLIPTLYVSSQDDFEMPTVANSVPEGFIAYTNQDLSDVKTILIAVNPADSAQTCLNIEDDFAVYLHMKAPDSYTDSPICYSDFSLIEDSKQENSNLVSVLLDTGGYYEMTLPKTGGIGTFVFYVVGVFVLLFMLVALKHYFRRTRD